MLIPKESHYNSSTTKTGESRTHVLKNGETELLKIPFFMFYLSRYFLFNMGLLRVFCFFFGYQIFRFFSFLSQTPPYTDQTRLQNSAIITLFSLQNEFLATLSYFQSYISFQELHSISSALLSVSTCCSR
jgi:hypothetical protein